MEIQLIRDLAGKVRTANRTFGHPMYDGAPLPFSDHQKRWTGYQYDDQGALTREFIRQNPNAPTGGLPQRDLATYSAANTDVANLFDPATTGASEVQWTRDLVGTLHSRADVGTSTKLWERVVDPNNPPPEHRLEQAVIDGVTTNLTYDEIGQLVSDGVHDYHYDPFGRLVGVTLQSNGSFVEGYLYDAQGRLTVVINALQSDYQLFHRVDDQIVAAYDETDDVDWQAVWGPGVDNLLEWRDRDGPSDYIPLVDHRNSVVGAWDIMSGSLVEVADYTAQGRVTLRDELEQPTCMEEGDGRTLCDAPGGMPFAFNSRWRSPRTGLVNMRARWYSPKLGQFTSHDPLGYVDTQNLYAFAGFDPINSWDPYGLSTQDQTEHSGDFNPPSNYNPDESWACKGVPFAIGCWLDNATRSTERSADDVARKRRKAVKRERKKAQKKLRNCQESGDEHCAGEKAQLLTVEVAEEVLPDTGPGVAQLGAEAAGGGAASATTKAGKEAVERGSKLLKRVHINESGAIGRGRVPLPRLDSTGKVHGALPHPRNLGDYTTDELLDLRDELKLSVQRRIEKKLELGHDKPHAERQAAEQNLIKSIEKHLDL